MAAPHGPIHSGLMCLMKLSHSQEHVGTENKVLFITEGFTYRHN